MFLRRTVFLIVLCGFSLLVTKVDGQVISEGPNNFVNDFAGIITEPTKTQLNDFLSSFETATSVEIAVVTVPSLNDIPIEDYATTLFKKWGTGKSGKDNGMLLLVAPKEKKIRIETGYGIEGAINDAIAGRIIRDTITPYFKQGDYSTGIEKGVLESVRIINDKYNLGFSPAKEFQAGPPQKEGSVLSTIFKIFIILIFILLFIKNPWLALFFLSGMGGGRRSGGFGGGGFGGFGGGSSGGGGASGSW